MSVSSQLPLFHVLGFSGHRQVADAAGVARTIAEVMRSLRSETSGEWLALSSVAAGGDQLFVGEALRAKFSWHAILPLPPAEFAKDFSPTGWTDVERLLERAEHVRVITENGTREDAYLDCGIETVNGADVLLAVWDGQPARGKGGTADVVEYALTLGKAVVVVDPNTLQVRKENFASFRRSDANLEYLNRLPEARVGWAKNPFKAPDEIFRFQQKCDHAASAGAPQFRRLIVSTVMLHVVATLVAAAGLAFGLHVLALPWIKLLCLVSALAVAIVLRYHTHSNHSWVRSRLAAEFCRSALATWGLPRAAPLFEDLDLTGIRGLTRSLHILHSRSANEQPVSVEEFKQVYLANRIDDQLRYYEKQEGRALPLFARLKLGFWIATILAIACTAAYAVSATFHLHVADGVEKAVYYFLPITLPVIAAAMISFISINDLQRRVARCREMRAMLEANRKQVTYCETWNSLERVVLKTERALLQEVLEWHSITSFSESH